MFFADEPDASPPVIPTRGSSPIPSPVARKLSEGWRSRRTGPTGTVGFACLASPDLVALTALTCLAGMTGATATGGTWLRVGHDRVILTDEPERTR